jgi:2-hydroxy-6-oxonona-2,4-dienedioate hydrolase
MRIALSLFLALHGVAHLVGFLAPWGLILSSGAGTPLPDPHLLLGGRVVVGDTAARGLGVLWLGIGMAFAVVAFGVWRRAPWAIPAFAGVTLASLLLCAAWWPVTRIGAALNALLLLGLTIGVYRAYGFDLRKARASATAGSTLVSTSCGDIEYATVGSGEPVLVLHGTGGGWDQGIHAARGLVEHGYQLIAPSRFGYLRTPMPSDPSPPAEADTWACFLDHLHIDRVAVVSFSAGAAPAVQLALRHPDRVSKLILVVPAAGGMRLERAPGPPPFIMNVALRFDFPMWATMHVARTSIIKLLAVPPELVPSLGPAETAELDEIMRMLLPVSSRRLGIMNDARTQNGNGLYPLERITAPTLLISAQDDLYHTLPVARHAARLIRGARLIQFETGGHLLIGHGKDVWPAVSAFLAPEARELAALGR